MRIDPGLWLNKRIDMRIEIRVEKYAYKPKYAYTDLAIRILLYGYSYTDTAVRILL